MKTLICRLLALLVSALTIAVSCQAAHAADLTAERLHQLCLSKVEAEEIACRYYLFGVFQGLSFGDSTTKGPDNKFIDRTRSHFCPPNDVSADQLISIFNNAARILMAKYPDDMKEAALGIVDAAYGHAYPCTRR